MAACILLGLAAPLLAAPPPATSTSNPPPVEANAAATKPAEKCLSDLRAFDTQMQKDGYWRGIRLRVRLSDGRLRVWLPAGGYPAANAAGYQDLRPGYEVRTLIVSANILARHGQQQSCEAVLATTRGIYKIYVADMHNGKMPMVDVPGWRQQQVAAAQPVTGKDTSFRSDELVGTDVRDPHDNALGSVEDLVMSPKTGAIAYLVIGRGGIFGIDEKYVPVPWEDFKITPNANLLVLDTTKARHGGRPAGEPRPIRDARQVRSAEPDGRCLLEGASLEQGRQLIQQLIPLSGARDRGNINVRGADNVVECIGDQRLCRRGE